MYYIFVFIKKFIASPVMLNAFLFRDNVKQASCGLCGPEHVSQEKEEEAWDISAQELWASCPHFLWLQARMLCRPAHAMAEPHRQPAQASTRCRSVQDHRGGAQAKEGIHTPPITPHTSNTKPETSSLRVDLMLIYTLCWQTGFRGESLLSQKTPVMTSFSFLGLG